MDARHGTRQYHSVMLNAATSYFSIADLVLSVFIDAMNYVATDTILVDDSF